jgi:hypothetical protein
MGSRSNLPQLVSIKRVAGANVSLTVPSTLNLPTAWTQIVASTTGPTRFICFFVTIEGSSLGTIQFDVGVGAGGSEVVVLNLLITGDSTGLTSMVSMPLDASLIPQGSRVALRATNITDASTVNIRGAVHLGETA